MLYAFVADFRENTTPEQRDEALARRGQWTFPEGVSVVAEYWSLGNSPGVYTVFESDDLKAMWQVSADWNDYFDVRIFPVMTSDYGLKHGAGVFANRPR